ncbi:SIMPL domain-containing protein [Bacterioplanoides sp.]|uniref:SIMPL domain-containing protein n=1 Tax=Bacterioplanoides sp. TaxID=2066072 RepID=UPI003B0017B8
MRALILSLMVISSMTLSVITLADERYIQVSGQGNILAMPDYLQINLNVQATASSLKQAKQQVDQAMNQLLKTTQSLNIAEADIDAAQIHNQPQYDWINNRREYRGEQVTRDVSITLRDKEDYAELAHQLLMIDEIRIHGSQLKFNDRQGLKNQAFAKAVKAAFAKASLMAQASDNKLGKVLMIQEENAHAPQPMMAMAKAMSADESAAPAPMLIQKQNIEARVIVRYQLK